MTDTLGWALVGFMAAVALMLWGVVIVSVIRSHKLNIKIPDLNASALVNSFKNPVLLLAIANFVFVVLTQVWGWDLSIGEYMAVATPVIALITGQAVGTIATYNKTKNGGST